MFQVRNARSELKAEHRAEGKDMIGIPAAVGVVPAHGDLALVIEQCVQYVQRLVILPRLSGHLV